MGQSSLLSALVWNVPIRKIVTLGHFTNEIVAIIITNNNCWNNKDGTNLFLTYGSCFHVLSLNSNTSFFVC